MFGKLVVSALLIAISICFATSESSAAEFTVQKHSRAVYWIRVEGVIEPGDYEEIYRIFKETGPNLTQVFLYSPGGDAEEAIKIADMFRALKVETFIPIPKGEVDRALGTVEYFESCQSEHSYGMPPENAENCVCASACTILWASGIERNFGMLRVHRPKFNDQAFSYLDPGEAELAYNAMSTSIEKILREFDFPEEGIQKMKSVSSSRAEKYEPFGAPTVVPFFDELLIARCGSSANKGEFSLLRIKKMEGRATSAELDRLSELEQTAGKIEECRMLETMMMRWDSFSEFFGLDYRSMLRAGEIYSE